MLALIGCAFATSYPGGHLMAIICEVLNFSLKIVLQNFEAQIEIQKFGSARITYFPLN